MLTKGSRIRDKGKTMAFKKYFDGEMRMLLEFSCSVSDADETTSIIDITEFNNKSTNYTVDIERSKSISVIHIFHCVCSALSPENLGKS